MDIQTHIVIMAGGVGSRLYPISTPERPKQFLDLLDCGKTLIQLTYERFLEVDPEARFWVVTSKNYAHFIKEQLPSIPDEQILLEPEPRNTAPCIAYACRKIYTKYPEAVIINTPADAYVPDKKAFAETMRAGLKFAATHKAIVCIGIKATEPNTGYGYIKVPANGGNGIMKVEAFKEKPDLATAEEYVRQGCYTWNAGIFIWSAATIEEEMREHAPGISAVMDKLEPQLYSNGEQEALDGLFPLCDKISIDYAVMEKSSHIHAISGQWLWSDLGSFESIKKIKNSK